MSKTPDETTYHPPAPTSTPKPEKVRDIRAFLKGKAKTPFGKKMADRNSLAHALLSAAD